MLCKFQGAISPLTTICNGRPPVAAPTTSGQVLGFHGSVIQRPPGRSRRAVATATTVGQASPGLEEEAQHQAAGLPQDEMQWTKQWYAVAVENLTDPSRPAPIQLLGQDLVLWRDGAGEWRCFQDRCPHRAAPLSEGKIWEDGTLMCSYHGWRFDSSGACTRIPQAASAEAEALACRSHRACAVAHPTKVAQGIVFVWGEGGPGAEAESETAPLPVDPLLAEAEGEPANVFRCNAPSSVNWPLCLEIWGKEHVDMLLKYFLAWCGYALGCCGSLLCLLPCSILFLSHPTVSFHIWKFECVPLRGAIKPACLLNIRCNTGEILKVHYLSDFLPCLTLGVSRTEVKYQKDPS